MKRTFLFSILLIIVAGCNSVRHGGIYSDIMVPENKLKSDVDYAHKKLKKSHPKLYWYIRKESLDYKFDSLKSTLTKPMTGVEFYTKLSPVIASIKQGHTSLYPLPRKLSKKEVDKYENKGAGPLSQFQFEIYDSKMYVIKNASSNNTITPGTEVITINERSAADLLRTYSARFASDGFNKTFKRHALSRNFSTFYTYENGVRDSIRYVFKSKDTIKNIVIKRNAANVAKKADKTKRKSEAEKEQNKIERNKKSIYGYNELTDSYNRNLRFIEQDSSIAVLKIREFMMGNYKSFYDLSFAKMYEYGTKNLILDLRDNPGGRVDEIAYLYTYLADGTFIFMDDSQVVSKTSMLSGDYFKGSPFAVKVMKCFAAPIYYPFLFFKVHKKEDGKYYYSAHTKPRKISPIAFPGKIYVLINGGSASASSVISSNLKGSDRAFFVGEETGGAFNGTVAGMMCTVKLPHSKLNLRFGLMVNSSNYETDKEGRGIFPDKTIVPTLEDRLNGKDPELDWILEKIKSDH